MTMQDERSTTRNPVEDDTGSGRSGIEAHGVDYVPHAERYGKAWHLAPVWLMGAAHLVSFTVGFIGPSVGLTLSWSLVAIITGACFGVFFSAFHSTQGPQLGLPQMIQSRAQFGYRGAVLIFIVVFLGYIGQAVIVSLLSRDSLKATVHLSPDPALIIAVLVGLIVATIGYKLIHQVARWLTIVFVAVNGVLTVAMFFTIHLPSGAWSFDGFTWSAFLIQFGATAGYMIAWAPYVSDYSRYLPANVSVPSVFVWAGVGMLAGGTWVMIMGAVLGNAFPDLVAAGDIVGTLQAGGDTVFEGFGNIVAIVGIPGLIYLLGMSLYGATLTLLSIFDTVSGTARSSKARLITTISLGVVAYFAAVFAPGSFIENLSVFLTILLYTLVPWTAVNLIDFYVVRHTHYSIRAIFTPDGMYGRWGWRGLTAYGLGFAVMIPFFSTVKWTGPIANNLGGADISPFIGLPVAAITYYVLTRSLDLDAEKQAIAQADAGLEPAEAA
ncbi:cytosine permease [Streptomyces sp. NPDC002928]|uniref:purine-cytosine permease family protein n=1 Tax=Streptomyces sp. NPDC002928 TaxID=3154440 RepID=UPI0033AFF333